MSAQIGVTELNCVAASPWLGRRILFVFFSCRLGKCPCVASGIIKLLRHNNHHDLHKDQDFFCQND